jgi:hypothetical protein
MEQNKFVAYEQYPNNQEDLDETSYVEQKRQTPRKSKIPVKNAASSSAQELVQSITKKPRKPRSLVNASRVRGAIKRKLTKMTDPVSLLNLLNSLPPDSDQ